MIQVRRESRPIIELIGREKTPVIIIDNYAQSTDDVIRHAIHSDQFKLDQQTYYPGIRAGLPKDYVIACLKPLMQGFYSVYKVPKNLKPEPKNNCYSLLTTQSGDLTTEQSIPHFDSHKPYFFAVLHYLDKGDHGGTGFFRHNPTGFERIHPHNESAYFSELNKFIDRKGKPSGFCIESSEHFNLYHQIDYRPNRLLIYPSNLLHSVLVNRSTDICADPLRGRLTANMFVEFS